MDDVVPSLESIFSEALDLESPAERARYLAEACRGNDELRAEVEKLLRAAPHTGDFPRRLALIKMQEDRPERPVEGPGSLIGRYKLLEQIGVGGMGTVYMAEQLPPMRRMVALKMINLGMNSSQVIARFEAERQALALMKHPNIASVFDYGTTDTGRPYFVMELIRGLPITEYCDAAKLPVAERLGLFVQVCRAVQHAHQKGIIHRDLKPSNIMVTLDDGTPVTKVIDFGIAKAIGQPLTETTLFTGFRQFVGSLPYMSPEQTEFSGRDVDTRSDIYSLGVLLYELLTGTTPFDEKTIGQAALDEARRIIHDDEPPKPSTRLSSLGETLTAVSAKRAIDPRRLQTLVRGELDWIVMKTLEKRRSRRYGTASELAKEIERFLANEPVEAGPPSLLYRLAKFAMRHRVSLAASLVIGVSLITTAVVSMLMAVRATRSEADSLAVQQFFRDKVLSAARPSDWEGGLGRDVSFRAVLDAAETSIAGSFIGRPLVEASVRDTLGMNYWYLGEPARSIPQLERAHSLRGTHLGKAHPDTLLSLHNLASAYADAGKVEEAIETVRRALAARTTTLGPTHLDTLNSLNNLAVDLHLAGRPDEAIPIFEQALALRQTHLGRNHPATLVTMTNLGMTYLDAGKAGKAADLLKATYDLQKVTPGPNHPETLLTLNNLGSAYWTLGRQAEALPLFELAFEIQKATLGPGHPRTIRTLNNLAAANWSSERKARAIDLFEEALRLQKAISKPDDPATLTMAYNLAVCYRTTSQAAKSVPLFESALAVYRMKPGLEDEGTLTTMNNLAESYLNLKRYDDAEPLLRECLGIRQRVGPDKWQRFRTMCQLGAALAGRKTESATETESFLIDGYTGLKDRVAQIPEVLRFILTDAGARIVAFYEVSGKPDKAAEWREKLKTPAAGTSSKS